MDDSELLEWLTLFKADTIPAGLLRVLMNAALATVPARSPRESCEGLDQDTEALVAMALASLEARTFAESALHWRQSPDNEILALTDAAYPPLLREIADPPPFLFVRGNAKAVCIPQLAVVGSRRCSIDGRENTALLTAGIVKLGLSICSGLATGIDTAAHKAALDAGGITLGVLGTGVDVIYPQSNKHLAARILENGALVSEFPLGYPPLPGNFPRRNRIISGLSLGVLVVEAAIQSGSLITARMAMEQNREVFAVPGSIRNTLSRGCHKLIREGASLVESPEDLRDPLAGLMGLAVETLAKDAGPDTSLPRRGPGEERIIRAMGYDPVSLDTLAARTRMSVMELQTMLMALELDGTVNMESGRYRLRRVARLQGN